MNPASAMPHGLGIMNVGEMLALPGLVTEKATSVKRLPGPAQELFRNVAMMLDEVVLYAIEQRTAPEFQSAVLEVFPKYFEGALGLSFLARSIVPKHVLETMSGEFFSEIESDFREQGLNAFGAAVRDQAIFTAWTLRKISDICQRIDETPLPASLEKSDRNSFQNFAIHAMRTRFHLDCLFKSMHFNKPIYPDVLGLVIDGLRSAVDAYAWARGALDLRIPVVEPAAAAVELDEEERQLLREATHDYLAEPA
jgi:hypothetical protein